MSEGRQTSSGSGPARKPWPGIASISQSVLCKPEPDNTKALFALVAARSFQLLTERLGVVRFVQVGANDGITADHLFPFSSSGRWRGVLIEPAPGPFQRLLDSYRGVEGLQFLRLAISDSKGRFPFYFVEGEDGLSSFSLETILAHSPKYDDLPGMIREIEVEADTLDSVCDRTGIAEPHVVAIDTEGTDDLVLKGFSLKERRPLLVLFEHCHLSAERSAALRDRLVAAGYRIIHDRHDALAIGEGTFDQDTTDFLANVISAARGD